MEPPEHIAIIMDGNGRWARSRSRPRTFGHDQGVKALERTAKAAVDLGVEYLTVFAFSTENWARPSSEVEFLFELLQETVNDELDRLQEEEDFIIKFIGRRKELARDLKRDIERIEEVSEDNDGLRLTVAFNYGGRKEIIDAAKNHMKNFDDIEKAAAALDENTFAESFYDPGMPDVDLLIRTGGEKRISNFLLWQLIYTELYFTPTLWPDFDEKDLEKAVADFNERSRRFGRVPEEGS